MIRIALTKGRLENKTVTMFDELGYDMTVVKNKGRRLILPVVNSDIEIVLSKAADVITYVNHGVCDIGIVGKDTIMEYGGDYYEMCNLGFGSCCFAVAGKKEMTLDNIKRVASKYPNVTQKYFTGLHMDVEIIKIDGSVELAPLLNLSDAIVDIVESGDTLKENGLVVIETIAEVSARLIVNKSSLKLKKDEIKELIFNISKYEI